MAWSETKRDKEDFSSNGFWAHLELNRSASGGRVEEPEIDCLKNRLSQFQVRVSVGQSAE